jgi:polyvinyl alcohol dehydrogenase (cytochrome)
MYGGHALTTGNEKGGPQKNNELNHALVAIIHRCSHHRLHPIYKLINQGEKSVLPKLFKLMGIVVIVALVSTPVFAAGAGLWLTAGHDLRNTRFQNTETTINVANVANLAVKWQFTTGGDVSATPAVDDTAVYFPDWAGNLFAVDRNTGALLWSRQIPDYTGVAGDYVRATPVVAGGKLIFGDQGGKFGAGARVMAVDKANGNLLWITQVENEPYGMVTQSAIVDGNTVYVGLASFEEVIAALDPTYPCCHERGSILALNARTGRILWKTYTVPEGYSGGAVWGSTPAVDHSRGSLYIATGNNYSMPQSVMDCVIAAGNDPAAIQACISPDNHFDSVMALNLSTGAVKWATTAIPFDAWNVACLPGFDGTNCPQPSGPDFDFGQGPALFTVNTPSGKQDLVGAGQKSGQYWAFNPDTGAIVWTTQVGPGGVTGGLQWGSATDGKRIYVADANSTGTAWTLIQNGQAIGPTVTSGFWSAWDAATGQILWQTADPAGGQTQDPGAVSAANGVVYACSADPVGHMYALNADTGSVLWSFASGGACNAGAAISNGTVYWGSGYRQFFTGNNIFYAFAIP